jgi:hypothetical protein
MTSLEIWGLFLAGALYTQAIAMPLGFRRLRGRLPERRRAAWAEVEWQTRPASAVTLAFGLSALLGAAVETLA